MIWFDELRSRDDLYQKNILIHVLEFKAAAAQLGQTGMGRPVVPLSRDKIKSCPGVPLYQKKGRSKCLGTKSSVLEHLFPVLECTFLLCPVLSRIPSQILAVPARPVPNFDCPGLSSPLARFSACPIVPLPRDNKGTSVPLSRKVALSRPYMICTLVFIWQ